MRRLVTTLAMLLAVPAAARAQNSGDAPAPYPAVQHTTTSFEHFGPAINNDAANPVTPAWTGSADDDGLAVVNLAKGATAAFTVDVQSLWAADDVAAWADWNNDGTWDPVAERIFWAGVSAAAPNGPVVNGANAFDVAVPANAVGTTAKIRVRIWDTSAFGAMPNGGPDGGGDPSGNTTWGEVEDYELTYAVVNAAPTAVTPAGSTFSGNAAAGFDLTIAAGATLANATLQLTDPDADPIDLNSVNVTPGPITGVTAPAPTTVASGSTISWTGTVDAATAPGVHTYTVNIDDNVNPNVAFDVRLTVTAAAPPPGGGTTPPPATGSASSTTNESAPPKDNPNGRGSGPGGLFRCSASSVGSCHGTAALAVIVVAALLLRRRG